MSRIIFILRIYDPETRKIVEKIIDLFPDPPPQKRYNKPRSKL